MAAPGERVSRQLEMVPVRIALLQADQKFHLRTDKGAETPLSYPEFPLGVRLLRHGCRHLTQPVAPSPKEHGNFYPAVQLPVHRTVMGAAGR